MRAAEASRPEVVFGPYGSGPALAAAAASKGVVWNHGGATARLARPAHPRVVNVASPAYGYLAARTDPTASGSAIVTGTRTVPSRPIRLLQRSRRVSFGSAV